MKRGARKLSSAIPPPRLRYVALDAQQEDGRSDQIALRFSSGKTVPSAFVFKLADKRIDSFDE